MAEQPFDAMLSGLAAGGMTKRTFSSSSANSGLVSTKGSKGKTREVKKNRRRKEAAGRETFLPRTKKPKQITIKGKRGQALPEHDDDDDDDVDDDDDDDVDDDHHHHHHDHDEEEESRDNEHEEEVEEQEEGKQGEGEEVQVQEGDDDELQEEERHYEESSFKGAQGSAGISEEAHTFPSQSDEDISLITRPPPTTVLVRNLDPAVTAGDLVTLIFSQEVDIISAVILTDENNESIGTAEVQFASEEEADKAYNLHSGKVFNGRPMYLSVLKSKQRKMAVIQPPKPVPQSTHKAGKSGVVATTSANGEKAKTKISLQPKEEQKAKGKAETRPKKTNVVDQKNAVAKLASTKIDPKRLLEVGAGKLGASKQGMASARVLEKALGDTKNRTKKKQKLQQQDASLRPDEDEDDETNLFVEQPPRAQPQKEVEPQFQVVVKQSKGNSKGRSTGQKKEQGKSKEVRATPTTFMVALPVGRSGLPAPHKVQTKQRGSRKITRTIST